MDRQHNQFLPKLEPVRIICHGPSCRVILSNRLGQLLLINVAHCGYYLSI